MRPVRAAWRIKYSYLEFKRSVVKIVANFQVHSFTLCSGEVFMKQFIGMILFVVMFQHGAAEQAATDRDLIEQASEIADGLSMPFDEKRPLLPQVLEMRDELRDRVFEITRMTSRHSARCKRARRDLMEVNSLVRKLRSADE